MMEQLLPRIWWARPDFHENENWFLSHDSAPAHPA